MLAQLLTFFIKVHSILLSKIPFKYSLNDECRQCTSNSSITNLLHAHKCNCVLYWKENCVHLIPDISELKHYQAHQLARALLTNHTSIHNPTPFQINIAVRLSNTQTFIVLIAHWNRRKLRFMFDHRPKSYRGCKLQVTFTKRYGILAPDVVLRALYRPFSNGILYFKCRLPAGNV